MLIQQTTANSITSTNLLTSLNTNHFTDTQNKININANFQPTTAGAADTANSIISTNLLSSLNTNHFTDTENKININTNFKPTTTGTVDTATQLMMMMLYLFKEFSKES